MSDPAGVFAVSVFAAVIAVFLRSAYRATQRRRALMAALGANGGSHGLYEAHFTREGVALRYHLWRRGSGKYVELESRVEARLPRYPLTLHVRRTALGDRGRVAKGKLTDIEVGAKDFDTSYIVEAAPADVVRALLDRPARDAIVQHRATLDTDVDADSHRILRLAVVGWILDAPTAEALIAAALHVAGRVRDVYTEVDAATPPAVADGAPYRPALDDTAREDAAAAREREVAEVEAIRKRRS